MFPPGLKGRAAQFAPCEWISLYSRHGVLSRVGCDSVPQDSYRRQAQPSLSAPLSQDAGLAVKAVLCPQAPPSVAPGSTATGLNAKEKLWPLRDFVLWEPPTQRERSGAWAGASEHCSSGPSICAKSLIFTLIQCACLQQGAVWGHPNRQSNRTDKARVREHMNL